MTGHADDRRLFAGSIEQGCHFAGSHRARRWEMNTICADRESDISAPVHQDLRLYRKPDPVAGPHRPHDPASQALQCPRGQSLLADLDVVHPKAAHIHARATRASQASSGLREVATRL